MTCTNANILVQYIFVNYFDVVWIFFVFVHIFHMLVVFEYILAYLTFMLQYLWKLIVYVFSICWTPLTLSQFNGSIQMYALKVCFKDFVFFLPFIGYFCKRFRLLIALDWLDIFNVATLNLLSYFNKFNFLIKIKYLSKSIPF